jgi:cyanophycinase
MTHQTLILVGSGEFTDALLDIDQYIFELLDKSHLAKNIAIIPTAAGEEADVAKWIKKGEAHFQKLGASVTGITIYAKHDALNPQFSEEIDIASLLYFSGGKPSYLIETLSHTPFLDKVLQLFQNGRFIAASSAGAMIMGKHYLSNPYQMMEENQEPIFKPGLGLTSFTIIPHFNGFKKENPEKYALITQKFFTTFPTDALLGISEDTAVIISANKAIVKGNGSVFVITKDQEKEFKKEELIA